MAGGSKDLNPTTSSRGRGRADSSRQAQHQPGSRVELPNEGPQGPTHLGQHCHELFQGHQALPLQDGELAHFYPEDVVQR